MWKSLLIVFFLIVNFGSITYAKCPVEKDIVTVDNNGSFCYKNYIIRIQQDRAIFYNALNLSDEQIKKREEFLQANSAIYEQKFQELKKESLKLKVLQSAGASERDIFCQKNVVRKVKNEIDNLLRQENKAFKKCLTRDQRAKSSMINKLVRLECKRKLYCKNYYKSNPQMKYFGNPPVESCSVCESKN